MWIIRLALIVLLVMLVSIAGHFLSHRQKYQGILENRAFNLALVILYNLFCFLLAGLPSDASVMIVPRILTHSGVRAGFFVVGLVMIAIAVLVMAIAVRQRNTLGGENVKAGLLTGGVYRYIRHPIYAGIIGVSLGIALLTASWDGLLMIPLVIAVNIAQATIEEKYDIGKRFSDQYPEYKKQTKMLGPAWAWASIAISLLVVAVIGGGISNGLL